MSSSRSFRSARHGAPPRDPVKARRKHRRRVVGSILRICLVSVAIFTIYALAPLDQKPTSDVALRLALAMLAFFSVVALQILAVLRSPYPQLRAVEAVAVSVPLLIVVFASAYVTTGSAVESSFNEPLSRVDALYFTVTVFATVGFGDIAPTSEAARVIVTGQMIADLILIGLIAKVLFRAVDRRRADLPVNQSTALPTSRRDR